MGLCHHGNMEPTLDPRLIVALDFPEAGPALDLADRLTGRCGWFKVGLELYLAEGNAILHELRQRGFSVFLDLKLHDIANTVERATAQLARRGIEFLTIHAYPQTMAAAKEGVAGSALKLLAVTAMTSYSDADLDAAGYRLGVRDLVLHRAAQAKAIGIDGLVASAQEMAELRRAVGKEMILVAPGIRPAGGDVGDQKRVATPAAAIQAGADYLVVGRPILEAADPRAAAEAIQSEIAAAPG